MKSFLFKAARSLFFLAIGIVLLIFAFRGVSLEDLTDSLKRANFFWVGLTLLFAFVGYVSRAYRWKLLIKPLNYDPPLTNVFYALMIGYTANFAFPRVGEITRCGTLRKSDKIPLDSLLGTVIIERAIDLLVLIIIVMGVFFLKMDFFGAFLSNNVFKPTMRELMDLFHLSSVWNWLVLIFIFVALYFLLKYLNRRFSSNIFLKKLKQIIRGVIRGVKTIARMKDRWKFIFHTIIIWVMYFLMTYFLVFAFQSTSHLEPIDGLFLLVIGGIGMSAPVQGGIGVFHWINTLGLTVLYEIPKAEAVAYATVSHESQSILAILLGGVSFLLLSINKKKNNALK
ncbi:MAG: lysylphosphatidylglycerol synthase transmembrane domain-containing protein [Bacteroidia bacterium]